MSSGGRGGTARPRGGGFAAQNPFSSTAPSRGGRGGRNSRGRNGARLPNGNRGGLAQTRGAFTKAAAMKPTDTDGNAVSERYEALKIRRQAERQDAIDRGLMNDPDKQITLDKAITMVGTCQDMCAEYERVQRIVTDEVKEEEKDETGAIDEGRMVRKFHRPAAGYEPPQPSDLRPPAVLKRVCQYLFNEVIGSDASVGWIAKRHNYVWDRTRAVRNDFSIQQVNKPEDLRYGIECFEWIVRFHICTIHLLSAPDRPISGSYDAKQDREQMDKALLSLMQYYDDCRGRFASPNEAEFRAYCILFEIQSRTPDLEDRVQMWPRHIVADPRVQMALKLHAAATNTTDIQGPLSGTPQLIGQQDWNGFWQLIRSSKVSYLMGCVAETYFNHVRRIALQAVVRTTRKGRIGHPAPLEWTVDRIRPYFCFDADEQLEEFFGCYGLSIKENHDHVRFLDVGILASNSLPTPNRQPTQYKSRIVEDKRQSRTVPAIIEGLTVQQSHETGKIVEFPESGYGNEEEMADEDAMEENDEDPDSLFIPERKVEITRQSEPETQPGNDTSAITTAGTVAAASSSNGFSFAVPRATTGSSFGNPFGQTSTNPFAARPQSTGMFGQTTGTAIESASAPKFNFGVTSSSSGNATVAPTTTSLFAGFSSATTTTSAPPTGLGISSDVPSAKPLSFGFGSRSSAPAPSLLAPSAAPALSTTKATTPEPTWSFSNPNNRSEHTTTATTAASASEQSTKPTFTSTGGGLNAAPSTSVQLDSNSKSAPTSSVAQTNAPSTTQTSHTTHDTGAPAINSGSLSPTRRASINHQDTKPKRPSPLSNSFTAEDGPVFDASKAAKAAVKQSPREVSSQKTPELAQSPQVQSASKSSEFDATVSRLANELTFDPISGLLKQYVQQYARNVISQVQKTILQEIREEKLQDLRHRRRVRITKQYFAKWRHNAHVKALRNKSNLLRDRTRRRHLKREVAEGRLHPKVLSDFERRLDSRSSSRASSVLPQPKAADHQKVDAMFRSMNRNRRSTAQSQAQIGSKRPASALDGEMPPPPIPNGHKRAKSSSHISDDDRSTRTASTDNTHADLLKRSSFLGFSLPSDAPRASTTKTSYFRLKAMGLKPTPDSDVARGTKRSRSDSLDAASAKLEESRFGSSLLRSSSARAPSVRPPSVTSDRSSKANDEDETLFARLKAAREALKDGENFMRSEVKEEELRRSRSASRSEDHDSPSMERARAEARFHASAAESEYSASAVSSRDIPAYRLRESRFVPREHYGRAIERANEFRASRSRETSRPASRTEYYKPEGPGPSKLGLSGRQEQFGEAASREDEDINGTQGPSAVSAVAPSPINLAPTSKPTFGFGSQPAPGVQTLPTNTSNPFSQASSFATVNSNDANPFLQATAPVASTTNPFSQRPPASTTTKAPSPFSQNSASSSSWGFSAFNPSNALAAAPAPASAPAQQPSLGFGFSQNTKPADRTVQPEQIPNALSNSFGPTATAAQNPFAPATRGSPTPPQTGSYMPSQAASAPSSLLSDGDEDDELLPNGQEELFSAVNNAAAFDGGMSFADDNGAGSFNFAPPSAPHNNGYAGQFAALADYDDEEQGGEDEVGELEHDSAPKQVGEDYSDDELAAEDEDNDRQEPDSYQYGDVVDDEALEDDDDDELPNGHYRDYGEEYSGEEGAEGEEGDVEDYDEDGYDDQDGYDDDDEEEDELAGAPYANTYRSRAEFQAMKQFVPPQPNAALQVVGNNEDDAIELSD